MKKSLKKVMLFGAMLLALGASFVGCKDYDDDIDDLNNKINDLATKLEALGKTGVKSVTYNPGTGKLTVTPNDGDAQDYDLSTDLPAYTIQSSIDENGKVTINLLKDGQVVSTDTFDVPTSDGGGETPTPTDPFDPTKLVVKEDGKVYYGDAVTGVTLPTFTQEGAIITFYLDEDGEPYGYQIKDGDKKIDVMLNVSDVLPLKSLVFEPQAWLSGVQAMESKTPAYKQWTGNWKPEATQANIGLGEYWYAPLATDTTTIHDPVVAKYHLNPASVTKAQIKSISVKSDDIIHLGGRAAASGPKVMDNWDVVDGMLIVNFDMTDFKQIKSLDADKITTLAIQVTVEYNGEETTVTSDYAGVYRNVMQLFKLSLNDKEELGHGGINRRHLYGADATTENTGIANYATQAPFNGNLSGYAQVAIDSPYDYTVAHDASINLKEKIQTHYRERLDGPIAQYPLSAEKLLSDEELAQYGLKYRFYASDYYLGTNLTNQSDFFTVDENTGILKPRVFDDPSGTIAAVDREPLVRVELYDEVNKKVVNTGWIKLLIVKTEGGAESELKFDRFLADCRGKEFISTVYQMNVGIYNKLDLTHTEFHAIYTLETDANGEAVLETGDFGVVTQSVNSDPQETNLLVWNIDTNEMDRALARAANDSLFATVTYTAPGREPVKVTLKSEVYEATAEMVRKNTTYWNPGEESIFVNAEVPGTMTNLGDFFANINSTFWVPEFIVIDKKSQPEFNVTPVVGQTDLGLREQYDYEYSYLNNGGMGYFFQFKAPTTTLRETGSTGTVYTITVDNTAVNRYATAPYQSFSYLLATSGGQTQVVATIDTYTGYIEYNNGLKDSTHPGQGTLTGYEINGNQRQWVNYLGEPGVLFNDNTFATDLLNRDIAMGSNMFAATIETILYNACRDIKVTNGVFDATFYRPVNATPQDGITIIDSQNNGETLKYIDLVKFTDWRLSRGATGYWKGGTENFLTLPITGTATGLNGQNWTTYWEYYDIKSIELVKSGITTNMGGGDLESTPLSQVNSEISLDHVAVTVSQTPYNNPTYGGVLYTNIGAAPQSEFKLKLPIKVTYRWGEFVEYVYITVVE